jgi:hypothetical protein
MPEEPFNYFENSIEFSRNGNQDTWIYFNSSKSKVWFNFNIRSEAEIKQVYLKSLVLSIKELGIEIHKDNIMIPIENDIDKLGKSFQERYIFWAFHDTELFTTEEIQNAYSEQITLNRMYNKFKKVMTVEFSTTIQYKINGENKESDFIWKFKTKRVTSFAFWDAIMYI